MKQLLNILFALMLWTISVHGQQVMAQFVAQGNQVATTTQETKVADSETVDDTTPNNDSVTISILTCTPGTLVYELYGHTAIRVREFGDHGSDWVFNYGTFSFKQPHFMWRFMLGETDYELSVIPYSYFYEAYAREGRGIDEQILNLTNQEAVRVRDALALNLDPHNAVYRYNFFYDNCTTRALARVLEPIKDKVQWGKVNAQKTLRDIVHEYSDVSPWNRFGQDLLLGAEADQPADRSKQEFAPLYAERFLTDATVKTDKGVQPLVKTHLTLLPAQFKAEDAFPISPMCAFGMLFALTLGIVIYEWKKGKNCWQFDVLLYVAQGLTGCIITFLFFFSAHPAVDSNWLIVLFNPLPLVAFPWFMKAASQHKRSWLPIAQIVLVLITLVIAALGVQKFPPELYLIMATLFVRAVKSVSHKTAIAKK